MGDIFNFKEAKYNLRKFNDMAVGNKNCYIWN